MNNNKSWNKKLGPLERHGADRGNRANRNDGTSDEKETRVGEYDDQRHSAGRESTSTTSNPSEAPRSTRRRKLLRIAIIVFVVLALLGAGIGIGILIEKKRQQNPTSKTSLSSNLDRARTLRPSTAPTRATPVPSAVPSAVPSEFPTTLPSFLPTPIPTSCEASRECSSRLESLIEVYPPSTSVRLFVPGTCQNEAFNFTLQAGEVSEERFRQRSALAVTVCELDRMYWDENEQTLLKQDECDWEIVQIDGRSPCGPDGQLEIIRASQSQQNRRLQISFSQGTIPPEISVITTLKELTLAYSQLTGTIPSDLWKLSNLETLSLANNYLTGAIPNYVFELEDLVYVDLACNDLVGTIPSGVYMTAPDLQLLLLSNNKLSGTIPLDFRELPFTHLHLDNNFLVGSIPVINLTQMEELRLHNNQFSGTFPEEDFVASAQLSQLKEVTIYGNNILGEVNDTCILFNVGELQLFEVDLDKIQCYCCSQGEDKGDSCQRPPLETPMPTLLPSFFGSSTTVPGNFSLSPSTIPAQYTRPPVPNTMLIRPTILPTMSSTTEPVSTTRIKAPSQMPFRTSPMPQPTPFPTHVSGGIPTPSPVDWLHNTSSKFHPFP